MWNIGAMGLRADVLYDCGNDVSCTHNANGVEWYYSTNYSWGFVTGGASVDRQSCDKATGTTELRLCWQTDGKRGGRCGNNLGFTSDVFRRLIYHAN